MGPKYTSSNKHWCTEEQRKNTERRGGAGECRWMRETCFQWWSHVRSSGNRLHTQQGGCNMSWTPSADWSFRHFFLPLIPNLKESPQSSATTHKHHSLPVSPSLPTSSRFRSYFRLPYLEPDQDQSPRSSSNAVPTSRWTVLVDIWLKPTLVQQIPASQTATYFQNKLETVNTRVNKNKK